MKLNCWNPRRALVAVFAGCAAFLLASPGRLAAQEVHAPAEQIAFDRPEAWALKYFTSVTLLTGLGTPPSTTPGSADVALELGWIPALSDAQRLVGFNGTKPEDLNKTSLFVRPRVTIGLPRRLSLMVAVAPPIRFFGLKPKLLAVGIQAPVYESTPWTIGLRGYGQVGTVNGAYTCPTSVLGAQPGSPGNLYGCQAESSDTATLRYVGGEVSAAYAPADARVSPHAAVSVNYMDLAFQVNALTFGFIDNTHLASRGVTATVSGGISYALGKRATATADVFFTPLSVRRLSGSSIEGLFNVRALVAYRLR